MKERKLLIRQIGKEETEVYITSYDLLKRDIKEYEGIHFDYQIIDEAQLAEDILPGESISRILVNKNDLMELLV